MTLCLSYIALRTARRLLASGVISVDIKTQKKRLLFFEATASQEMSLENQISSSSDLIFNNVEHFHGTEIAHRNVLQWITFLLPNTSINFWKCMVILVLAWIFYFWQQWYAISNLRFTFPMIRTILIYITWRISTHIPIKVLPSTV